MVFGIEAETRTVESEAQGIGASIVNFFRSILDHIATFVRFVWDRFQDLIKWSIAHPERATLFIGSLYILFAP